MIRVRRRPHLVLLDALRILQTLTSSNCDSDSQPTRLHKNRKKRGHVSAGHGRIVRDSNLRIARASMNATCGDLTHEIERTRIRNPQYIGQASQAS